ncbi:MAG: hypothetical protein COA79_06235 [Planctomycetota bacterium]|nr:MAG: hypothetical protein COA79_06235 [Planctomycetota bacterium]
MADEDKPINADSAGPSDKMFSGKGLIVYIATIAIYTIILFYLLMGGKGKASGGEEGGQSAEERHTVKLLLRAESEIPKFIIEDIIVNIKLDKSGDTSKVLRTSLAFSIGFTKKERKFLESDWKDVEGEQTKYGEIISPEKYEDFNIIQEVVGVNSEDPYEDKNSYLRFLKNRKDEIRSNIMKKLNSVTYNELKDNDGQTNIAQSLISDVNEMLYELGLYKRVYKVSWIAFTFN